MSSAEQNKLDELFRRGPNAPVAPSLEGIHNAIERDLPPVRQISSPIVFTAAFLLITLAIAAASLYIMPSYGWDALMPLAKVSVFLTLGASAALLSFSLSLQMIPGSRIHWTPGLLVAGISVFILLVLAAFFQVRAESQFLHSGLICVRAGAPFAVPAAILFALLLRRGLVVSPRRAGLLCGMLAGMVSMAVLEVHCPNFDLLHIVIWHFGIPLAGAFAGYLLGVAAGLLTSSAGASQRSSG